MHQINHQGASIPSTKLQKKNNFFKFTRALFQLISYETFQRNVFEFESFKYMYVDDD